MNSLLLLSILGIILSIYATFIKLNLKKDRNYKAICDLNKNISCTKALSNKYGNLMGISNTYIGLAFYFIILILLYFEKVEVIFFLSLFAFLGSLYLAYLSYYKLKNFCLLCSAIYIINFLLLIFSYVKELD